MIRSFLIIILRILWRNKVTSFINIFSLAIGMTAFILIMLYVHHEFSYDKFNEHYDRIYRLEAGEYGKFPPIIGEYLRNEIPGIENVSRLACGFLSPAIYMPEDNPERIISVDVNLTYADSSLFSVFTLPFIYGNPRTALREPFTTIITEETSKKFFGDENPVGKTINWENDDYMVTGVIKEIKQSHIVMRL